MHIDRKLALVFAGGAVAGALACYTLTRELHARLAELVASMEHAAQATQMHARLQTLAAEKQAACDSDPVLNELEQDGMVVIKDVFSPAQVERLRERYHECWSHVKAQLPNAHWKTRRYIAEKRNEKTFPWSNALWHNKKTTQVDGTLVIDMGHGRYDFYYGLENGITGSDEFLKAPKVTAVLDKTLKDSYSGSPGALPVAPGEEGTDGLWHRDQTHIWDDEALELPLPTFYYTMVVPLVDITEADGPTEFFTRSHRLNLGQMGLDSPEKVASLAASMPSKKATMRAGDVALFDGKVLHRGSRNVSRKTRDMLYVVYKKHWFQDDHSYDFVEE